MYRVREGVRLVLASASPRRRELLGRVGLEFTLAAAEIDESLLPAEQAGPAARRLAGLKARAVQNSYPGGALLAADTLVTLDGIALGKPRDEAQARDMLQTLSGREHEVVTGYCLLTPGGEDSGLAVTKVSFRKLTSAEIDAYLASGEFWDKAGAYAIQERGAALVSHVSGSYTNVVGLPLAKVIELLLQRDIITPMTNQK